MIPLAILCAFLAAQLVVLWRKCERLEREKGEAAAESFRVMRESVNRILSIKGVRPIAAPLAPEPERERGPVVSFTADELDNLRDMVRERIEVAALRGESLPESLAKQEVWASLGYASAPVEL